MVRTLLTVLALATGLAACSTSVADAPADAPAADAPTDADVAIDTFAYAPATVTVAAGTTVVWTNEDATRHTVTAGSEADPRPEDFDLPVDEQGDTVALTFDEPGSHHYHCVLHPFMEGVVEVTG